MNSYPENYIVFTDLDGTLLDHDDYNFDEAKPALQKLRELDIPVIPCTSKTLAELSVLTKELNLFSPVITENGGVIAVPSNFGLSTKADNTKEKEFDLIYLSKQYSFILEIINKIRHKFKFEFRGFNDMTVAEIAEITGLNYSQSENAKQRLCSEPIIWRDDEEALAAFISMLKKYGFNVTQGGRFYHVMGNIDKSDAMKKVVELYQPHYGQKLTTIALGDSPNDISVLSTADIGVVIRKKDQSCLTIKSDNQIYTTQLSGPAGWNEFFLWLLNEKKTQKEEQ